MSLSVCLLTRNQCAFIAAALESLAGLPDEIVVADAHSTDGTAELAQRGGARVLRLAWEDDFAAGRNFVIGQARGDWVLWFNADEELTRPSHDAVRACMGHADTFAWFVHLHNVLSLGPPQQVAEMADLRLFRRRPDLRFIGRAHPRLEEATIEQVRREGLQVRPSPVVIRSYAPLTERTEGKLRWTVRLMELELRDRPGQLHYEIELGRTLLALREPRGHAVLAAAAEHLLAARDAPAPPSMKAQVLLEYLLTTPPPDNQARLTRDEAAALARRWFPASPILLYLLAQLAFAAKDFAGSARLLERLVELGRTGAFDRSHSFPPGLVREEALVNLAACYQQMGEHGRAAECYQRLLNTKYHPQAVASLQALDRVGATAQTIVRPQ
jgi:hypothetical protein